VVGGALIFQVSRHEFLSQVTLSRRGCRRISGAAVGGFGGVVVVSGLFDLGEVGGPFGERVEEGGEAAAEGADFVLDARWDLGVVLADHQAVAFQLP
jgi:hypothetical protein